jgi:hypothetical protein
VRVVFCHRGGVPSDRDGSVRSLQVLRWLSERHDTALLPVYLPAHPRPRDGEVRDRLRTAGLSETSLLPGAEVPGDPSVLRGRPMARLGRRLRDPLLSQLDGADWLWVACPYAVADRVFLAECRARGIRISWDWDCLSLLSARWGRARWPSAGSIGAYASATAGAVYERRYLRSLHCLTVPGERDRIALQRTTGRRVLRVRPPVAVERFGSPADTPDAGPLVVFAGSAWPPNVDGITWVLRDVWPAVRSRVPDARLRIVGRDIAEALPAPVGEGVDVVGTVPDIAPELQRARVVICPIFFGGGIPNKLLEAAAAGKATLATRYCARVLGNWPFEASDSAQHWADTLVSWLTDAEHARSLGRRARAYVEREWGERRWSEDMAAVEAVMTGGR